jgi:hypothetical protein
MRIKKRRNIYNAARNADTRAAAPDQQIARLIKGLDSLTGGEEAAARLAECGAAAIPPLRSYLLRGRPRKIFQPRVWSVQALARLGGKDVLLEYLFLTKNIADPEDRFGEEAVESAAARALSAWPSESMFRTLMELSKRRTLAGLIDALVEYKRPECIPYFEHALEDDYYRPAAERAFVKLGAMSRETLAFSAVRPHPGPSEEAPASLRRRRSAIRALCEIGILDDHWRIIHELIMEPDMELAVTASKLGLDYASQPDRLIMARRMIEFMSTAPWHLQEDIENILIALENESSKTIEHEIARRMEQPQDVLASDGRLAALLRIRRQFKRS